MVLIEGYAEIEDNEKRKAVWLTNVSLPKTHELRAKLNNGQAPDPEVLKPYEPAVIASVLKLYLLELPGSKLLSKFISNVRSYHVIYGVRHCQEYLRLK